MQESSAKERAAGIAEYQAAKGEGSYAQGAGDRFLGKTDQVLGSITGKQWSRRGAAEMAPT